MSKQRSTYERATRLAYKGKEHYPRVFSLLETAVKEGDARAAYALATWYIHGRYVKRNRARAVLLLKQAVDGGIVEAMFDLAICYEKGAGTKLNYKAAARHYTMAALRGDKQAHYEVGRCLYYGIGMRQDRDLAWVWLDRARELGINGGSHQHAIRRTAVDKRKRSNANSLRLPGSQ